MKIRKLNSTDVPPQCACGCGQSVSRSKITREWNKFLHGHNSKSSSNNAKFKPGNKFGKGRPEGSRNRVTISAMNLIKGEEIALTRKAIEMARNGNPAMLQIFLSRILPPQPKDELIKLEGLPSCNDLQSAKQLSSFLLEKLAEGKITPTQANVISGIIEKHINCLKVIELEPRLTVIEEALKAKC